MSPAPDDTAQAMGLHEVAGWAVGLMRRRAAWCRETAQENGQGPFTAALTQDAAEHEAAADALEAAVRPEAGDEERALRTAERAVGTWLETCHHGRPRQEDARTLRVIAASDMLDMMIAIRMEAAATERARLTQPEPERVERLARDACFAEAESFEPGVWKSPDKLWQSMALSYRKNRMAFVRRMLAALAADPPCPACGATDESGCRGLEVDHG